MNWDGGMGHWALASFKLPDYINVGNLLPVTSNEIPVTHSIYYWVIPSPPAAGSSLVWLFILLENCAIAPCQSMVITLGKAMHTIALNRISSVIPHHVDSIGVTPSIIFNTVFLSNIQYGIKILKMAQDNDLNYF